MEKVSIIIPNWNGEGYLGECLESLMGINYDNYNILLVDNGSFDGSVRKVEINFPEVFIIKNKENLGFSSAVNQGINHAIKNNTEFILLLNNDTVVELDFLARMVDVMLKNNRVGIVGCKIYYFTEPNRIWFAGGDFINWRASGKHRYWAKRETKNLSGVYSCDFITGCAILIRRNVFNDIGFLFEPYFLGVEDLDFCYQARKAGWEIKVNLDAKIYHKVSLSREGEFSFSNGYYGTRNRLYFAFKREKNYTAGIILLLVIIPVRIIQWTIQKKFQMMLGMLFGVKDFFQGKMGKRVV